jgi:catechol 2,3-dioxygenase-like lactoylglutathione lyase family enzyme
MKGISHITFIVRDLERMAVFLCQGLGAKEIYDSTRKNFSNFKREILYFRKCLDRGDGR